MAVNARALVSAPAKALLNYGLFSVAEMRTDAGPGAKWQLGVTWQNTCPDASSTYDECILGNAFGVAVTGIAEPNAKEATAERSLWGAIPFTVVVEVDCSPPGFWEQSDDVISTVFGEAEHQTVEQVFWTGVVDGTADLAFPHLAADAVVLDGETGDTNRATLQLVAANVGPTGGSSTPLDVVEALGRLESSLSACVMGVGVIHVPTELLPHLLANHLLRLEDGVYYSPAGHKVAVSPGYLGTAPDGAATDGVQWMYGTGPVFMYRSRGRYIGDKKEAFDHSLDTLKRIYERTYVIGYDCCLFGVAVSTGGVITGAINSAT